MVHIVYMLISLNQKKSKTYIGYSKNVRERLYKHNSGSGAKSTRGRTWKVIYQKKFDTMSLALKYEYFLKKNRKLRNYIKTSYEKKNYNF